MNTKPPTSHRLNVQSQAQTSHTSHAPRALYATPAPPQTRSQIGARGEALALRYLEELGYILEAQNWRGDRGELDLIMRYDTLLVVVEVRTTSTRWLESPAEATSLKKRRQVARCADEYLSRRQRSAPLVLDVRFDVIGVLAPALYLTSERPTLDLGDTEIDHIEDAYHSPWAF